jgi:hypothetical protein
MRVIGLALALATLACSQRPPRPTEAEARAAFATEAPRLKKLEQTLRDTIQNAGLASPRPECATGEQACFDKVRKRDADILAAQKRVSGELAAFELACAEITISTTAHGEELVSRVATCPPGRRGDLVEHGAKIDEWDVGWGVYFKNDQAMRRGISARREWKDGDATAVIEMFVFIGS